MPKLPAPLRPMWPYAKRAYTATTGVLSGPAMRAARRPGWYGPTGVAETLEQAGDRINIHPVAPAERIVRPHPRGLPAGGAPFADRLASAIPPQRVVEIPDGRVLGPARAVLTADGTLLHELVHYFGTRHGRQHPAFLTPRASPPTRVAGTVGVLASRGDGNYYHFLHDVIARLAVLERSGLPQPDAWYLPLRTRFQREIVELVGLPAERIIDADRTPHLQAERLLVPSVPDLHLGHPAWATSYLRDLLLPADAAPESGRRVYVTRGRTRNTRIVTNEDELLDALRPLGFTVVDPGAIGVAEQIATFAGAETIVAPHGAALANLAFAGAGARVIELFAPDYVMACYWKLATTVPGLEYRFLIGRDGRSGLARRAPAGAGVSSDITVDVADVLTLLAETAVNSVSSFQQDDVDHLG